MPFSSSSSNSRTIFRLRSLTLAALIALFVLILLGGVLRLSQAGGACLDWPTCLGQWTIPAGGLAAPAVLDYLHRLFSLVSVLLLGAAGLAVLPLRHERLLSLPWAAALAFIAVQVLLGAWMPRMASPWSMVVSAAHLGFSLLALAAEAAMVCAAYFRPLPPENELRLTFRSPFSRLALLTLGVTLFLLLNGAVVARLDAGDACSGWPLCIPQAAQDIVGWLSLSHRLLVGLTTLMLGLLFIRSWRTQRSHPAGLVSTTAAFVLFLSQALLGARLAGSIPTYLLVIHQATAIAFWIALVITCLVVGLEGRTASEEAAEALEFTQRAWPAMARDFLMLTKPIVVLLLLVTTYAGMVIGARAWPSLSLTFWTLLGGFMAAGGSGAINQYIDRDDDTKMQRTQKRPIPAGRLAPAEGLAFGLGMVLASFYLLVAFVNLLAALLTLAGFVYYVLIYSIFLKKATVQNIVIGGGAGAIPPLVGWAAATGSLNIPALFLFAVVFMWTPPHFWALALVRRNDYARAGVPMLPVVRGEGETRWQIFIYTLELVGLTLLLPLIGLGGGVYLVGAIVLGLWLLVAAWRVWRQGGNKLAWKMYRYSSMYLAFLFFVLMADALIK